MNRLEDRLRDAFAAAAETVHPESVGGQRAQAAVTRTRRLTPLAAAAAVAVIVVAASIAAPLLLAGGNQGRPSTVGTRASAAPTTGPSALAHAVPTVTGMPVTEATVTLQAAGLGVTVTTQMTSGVPPGTVIAQNPVPGTQVPPGATVTIVINGTMSSSSTFALTPEPTRPATVAAYAVTIVIPVTWALTPNLGVVVGYRGADGWMEVRSAAYATGLRAACMSIAAGNGEPVGVSALPNGTYRDVSHPYGSHPRIEYRSIDGRPGCLIIPSGDAPTVFRPVGGPELPMTSALVEYRSPLTGGANFLVISADPPHLLAIVTSLQLHH